MTGARAPVVGSDEKRQDSSACCSSFSDKISIYKLGLNWAKLRSDWNWGLFKIYAKLINKTKESKCTC